MVVERSIHDEGVDDEVKKWRAKQASIELAAADTALKNKALSEIAQSLAKREAEILQANAADLELSEQANLAPPLLKRLKFDAAKLADAVAGINSLINLPDPVGVTLAATELDQGLELYRVSCAIGVIGVILNQDPILWFQISPCA